jgi:TPR repeat protein
MSKIAWTVFAGLAALGAANTIVYPAPHCIETVAFAGDARAQAILGFKYEQGRGVPQDYAAAASWYMCAAEQGDPSAQYLLGLMYDKGHGIAKNEVLAYKWLSLAAAHAQPAAREHYQHVRDAVAAKLTAKQTVEAQWLASSFVPAMLAENVDGSCCQNKRSHASKRDKR